MANMTMQTGGAWQNQDLASFPTAYASSLANKFGIPLTTAAPKASSSFPGATSTTTIDTIPRGNTTSSNTSLGLGAKLGISFGSVIAFVILSSLVVVMLRMRQRHKKMAQGTGTGSNDQPAQIQVERAELEHTEQLQSELESKPQAAALPIELAHMERLRAELDAKTEAARSLPIELDANCTNER
ncbi:hypothetical protein N0V90_000613 [Kalmusia sp. IMI 367209]|nr:hypothetical protein N0V90_000613 [Kalmusia sp. IMI 367209]